MVTTQVTATYLREGRPCRDQGSPSIALWKNEQLARQAVRWDNGGDSWWCEHLFGMGYVEESPVTYWFCCWPEIRVCVDCGQKLLVHKPSGDSPRGIKPGPDADPGQGGHLPT
jgi:hypothetical protein